MVKLTCINRGARLFWQLEDSFACFVQCQDEVDPDRVFIFFIGADRTETCSRVDGLGGKSHTRTTARDPERIKKGKRKPWSALLTHRSLPSAWSERVTAATYTIQRSLSSLFFLFFSPFFFLILSIFGGGGPSTRLTELDSNRAPLGSSDPIRRREPELETWR